MHITFLGEGVILDRSVYSDCVFANVGHSEGYISKEGVFFIDDKCNCFAGIILVLIVLLIACFLWLGGCKEAILFANIVITLTSAFEMKAITFSTAFVYCYYHVL